MQANISARSNEPGCIFSFLIFSLLFSLPALADNHTPVDHSILAEDAPSMDFLEYLGAEENEIDGELSSPVDLDLEQFLVAKKPVTTSDKQDSKSEDNKHE